MIAKLENFATLRICYEHSTKKIEEAREYLTKNIDAPLDYLTVLAVGSYGRFEAHPDVSDFEWLLIYDDKRVNRQESDVIQAHLTRAFAHLFGRERLSINKTFGDTYSFSDLGTQVGGLAETNKMLTYRMLTLTEGIPLLGGSGYESVIGNLARVYGQTHTAGYRLLSLATELARYYRVVRVAYKYGADEAGKPWAIRSLKMRSMRRFNYLASALHFVAFGPRINYSESTLFDVQTVANFMVGVGGCPADRMIRSIQKMDGNQVLLDHILDNYDHIFAALSSPQVREGLGQIKANDRFDNEVYEHIRSDCKDLHRYLVELVLELPNDYRTQVLEMFLL